MFVEVADGAHCRIVIVVIIVEAKGDSEALVNWPAVAGVVHGERRGR